MALDERARVEQRSISSRHLEEVERFRRANQLERQRPVESADRDVHRADVLDAYADWIALDEIRVLPNDFRGVALVAREAECLAKSDPVLAPPDLPRPFDVGKARAH